MVAFNVPVKTSVGAWTTTDSGDDGTRGKTTVPGGGAQMYRPFSLKRHLRAASFGVVPTNNSSVVL